MYTSTRRIRASASRALELEHLAAWAVRNGLAVVATGDFTRPASRAEFNEKLVPDEPGLFRLRPQWSRSRDRYRLVSNSDAHSHGKLGCEATTFDCALDYFALRHALESGEGYIGTRDNLDRNQWADRLV